METKLKELLITAKEYYDILGKAYTEIHGVRTVFTLYTYKYKIAFTDKILPFIRVEFDGDLMFEWNTDGCTYSVYYKNEKDIFDFIDRIIRDIKWYITDYKERING